MSNLSNTSNNNNIGDVAVYFIVEMCGCARSFVCFDVVVVIYDCIVVVVYVDVVFDAVVVIM